MPHTIEYVYPNGYILSEGWRWLNFRNVKQGEHYISTNDGRTVYCAEIETTWPRIVVEPLNIKEQLKEDEVSEFKQTYGEPFKLEEGWLIEDYRVPKAGESIVPSWRTEVISADENYCERRLIVKRAEVRPVTRKRAGQCTEPLGFEFETSTVRAEFYPMAGWFAHDNPEVLYDVKEDAEFWAGEGKAVFRRGVECHLTYLSGVWEDEERTCWAVHNPADEWDFEEGCRVALKRAMEELGLDKEKQSVTRGALRSGFTIFNATGPGWDR